MDGGDKQSFGTSKRRPPPPRLGASIMVASAKSLEHYRFNKKTGAHHPTPPRYGIPRPYFRRFHLSDVCLVAYEFECSSILQSGEEGRGGLSARARAWVSFAGLTHAMQKVAFVQLPMLRDARRSPLSCVASQRSGVAHEEGIATQLALLHPKEGRLASLLMPTCTSQREQHARARSPGWPAGSYAARSRTARSC